jgi:light-harvesting complex 1 beta chain
MSDVIRRPVPIRREDDDRQFHWMVTIGFLILLVPAAIARVSGWRWRPWPPGPEGYRSIVSEAREASETYVLFAFLGW